MTNGVSGTYKTVFAKLGAVRDQGFLIVPGFFFCFVLALASSYISEHFGASDIFAALLLGMAFNSVSKHEELAAGIGVSAKKVLRIGVALLGVRISFAQIYALGYKPIVIVCVVVIATIAFSVLLARVIKLDRNRGFISGAAVAICGASAAMAVAAALPGDKNTEKHLLCTLVGVTGLSTIVMVVYPGIVMGMGMDIEQMGLFLGASIHDVAHVFGAGHMVSEKVAELAVYTKMLRVTTLVPVIMVLAFFFRDSNGGQAGKIVALPTFLVFFIALMLISNTGIFSKQIISFVNETSKMCLLVAIAALGTRTNLLEMWRVGLKPLLLLLVNTIFIGGIALLMVL